VKYVIKDIKKLPQLFIGFFLLALGLSFMKQAEFGLNAWGVFHQGLSISSGISFGKIIQIVGIILLLISVLIKIYPGIGTILNIVFVGMFVDWIDVLLINLMEDTFLIRSILFILGLVLNTYGTAIYIMCELGKGPRDGLFIGLTKLTGINVKYIRPLIEMVVLIAGYFLGGIVSAGTIIITIFSGYLVSHFFSLHHYDPKLSNQRKIRDYFKK